MTTQFVLGVVTLAAGLSAQNIVQNGDFEDPTFGWTLNSYGINPAVESFDTTGTGLSKAYGVTPGWQNAQIQTTHSIEQDVSVVDGEVYEVRVDVAADWRNLLRPSESVFLRVRVDGGKVVNKSFAKPTSGQPKVRRIQLAGRYTASMTGTVTVSVQYDALYVAEPGAKFRVYIDNVDMRPTRVPFFTGWLDRFVGRSTAVVVYGSPGITYAVYVSPLSASPRLTIPGVTGDLGIDLSTALLAHVGIFNGAGSNVWTLEFPDIRELSGVPLYWQVVQWNHLLGIADLSWETMQGFR